MTVAELFSDKSRWASGALAYDIHGNSVGPDDSNAVCWCLEGALHKCYLKYYPRDAYIAAERKLASVAGFPFCTTIYNDTHTYEEVLSLVRKAGV